MTKCRHHLPEVHRHCSCKTFWSTFLVLLFERACCLYAPLHVTIRQVGVAWDILLMSLLTHWITDSPPQKDLKCWEDNILTDYPTSLVWLHKVRVWVSAGRVYCHLANGYFWFYNFTLTTALSFFIYLFVLSTLGLPNLSDIKFTLWINKRRKF